MRLVEYDKEKLNNRDYYNYKKTKLQLFLEEFVASGLDCAKIEGWNEKYVNSNSCQTTMMAAIRRHHLFGVTCKVRNGEVFLVKVEQ